MQEVLQKRDISDLRSSGSPPSVLTLRQSCWVTVWPLRGHLTLQMNITCFYQKVDAKCFLFNNFLGKKKQKKTSIFRENYEKLHGCALPKSASVSSQQLSILQSNIIILRMETNCLMNTSLKIRVPKLQDPVWEFP